RTVFRAPASTLTSNDICLKLIADGDPALSTMPTDRGPVHRGPWAAARRGAIEFMRKAEYAYDYGMPQWLVQIDRRLARLHLDRVFLGRHKFFHFRVWYRDQLGRYVQEMLLDPRTLSRPYVERKQLETLVTRHVTGRANHTLEIHKLLTLEHVHRLFV